MEEQEEINVSTDIELSDDEAFADIETAPAEEQSDVAKEENEKPQAENSKADEKPNKSEADSKSEQPKEINPYAKARREREAKQKELIERVRREAFEEGQIKTFIGMENQFTGQKIEDEYDAKEYLMQVELYKQNKDPVKDLYAYKKQKEIEKQAVSKKESEQASFIENDRNSFMEKYPNVDLEELGSNPVFQKIANNKIGKVPLSELYEETLEINKLIDERAQEQFNNSMKKQQSSPGSLSGANSVENVDYASMSDADFDKMLEKAKRGDLRKY